MNYVAISRDIWNDPDFPDEPMSQREAFMWLVAEAAWKPRKVRRANAVISLQRGELAHSIRFMAEAWGWHRARVERFLKVLKNRDSIETRTETGVTVITICKYDKFQGPAQTAETPVDREPRQHRDSTETNENQYNQDNQVKARAARPAKPEKFEEAWSAWPKGQGRNCGKPEACRAWLGQMRAGADESEMLGAVRRYTNSAEPEYALRFDKFMRDEVWREHAPAPSSPEQDRAAWEVRVSAWARSGRWPDAWGPEPGKAGCKAPAALIQAAQEQAA